MADKTQPVYLERESYRRRRLADVACIAPVVGLVMLVMPAVWASESRTAEAMVYVFSVWAFLILLMGIVSRRLSREDGPGNAAKESAQEQ